MTEMTNFEKYVAAVSSVLITAQPHNGRVVLHITQGGALQVYLVLERSDGYPMKASRARSVDEIDHLPDAYSIGKKDALAIVQQLTTVRDEHAAARILQSYLP